MEYLILKNIYIVISAILIIYGLIIIISQLSKDPYERSKFSFLSGVFLFIFSSFPLIRALKIKEDSDWIKLVSFKNIDLRVEHLIVSIIAVVIFVIIPILFYINYLKSK